MNNKKLMVDPPDGWRYNFPKVCPKEHQHRILDWVVESGYPKEEIEKLGKHFYVRCWEIE
jgi:hypothetical protein